MSFKETELITPATSGLSHDDNSTSNPTEPQDQSQQLKMSAPSISTPISSPSFDPSVLPATKISDPITAAPLSPSATSAEHDVQVKDVPENDKDSDDEDDDLFNEPEDNEPLESAPKEQDTKAIAPAAVSETAPAPVEKPATEITIADTQVKEEDNTSEKRVGDAISDNIPPTKRVKTEETVKTEAASVPDNSVFQSQDLRDPPPGAPRILSKHQVKFALASLRSVKRLKDAAPFVEPVDHVKLNIPTYYTVITNPMDLGTMERKVTEGKYSSVTEFLADMDLIVSNCVKFNGAESFISNMARNIKASFDKHMNNMPRYELPAINSNTKAKKRTVLPAPKPQRASVSAPSPLPPAGSSASPKKPLKAPASRDSTSSVKTNSSARPVKSGSTASKNVTKKASPSVDSQPFALQPSGLPTIRRESSAGGRPKREIHPPKSKDLPYGDVKPRKKKFATELRFCANVLKELMSKKHENFNFPFLQPVDPVALNCPSYFNIIKHPMDLSTMQHKFNTNQYETAEEFESDVRLMVNNCYKFNPEGSPVNAMGHQLESLFDKKWKDLPATPPSPPPMVPESESESESDFSESEIFRENNAIKLMESQITRMMEDLDTMKREALINARAARDFRKKNKKTKRANGATTAPAKKGGKASSGSEGNPSSRRKSSAGSSGRRVSPAANGQDNADGSPYVTYEMKEELSKMCQNLPEKKMRHVLKLIQEGIPNFNSEDQEEVELEIDQLNPATVLKLYEYVVKGSNKRPRTNSTTARHATKQAQAAQRRKGKPLSEDEQTRQIEELQRKLAQFDEIEAAGSSPPAEHSTGGQEMMISASGAGMASAGNAANSGNDSSDDDDDDDDDSSSSEED